MGRHIPRALATAVRERAGDVCEYCHIPQRTQEATFHIDHIRPLSLGGATAADNLALACVSCSLHKAAKQSSRDPRTNKVVPLFHPRTDTWNDHFAFTANWRLRGRTPSGRATVEALQMNRPVILAIRQELVRIGTFPIQ